MHTYDFISRPLTRANVEAIISRAGYQPDDYTYEPRVGHDGFVVTGDTAMAVTRLRNAAHQLNFNVEISSPPSLVRSAALAATAGDSDYQVTINMSSDTVSRLTSAGFFLYGFKAVQSSSPGTVPLVWFKTKAYSTETQVQWQEKYEAYTSQQQLVPNGKITSIFPAPISLGQTLNVQEGGVGKVSNGGPSTAISINNTTSTEFTCGISQQQDGTATPMCGFSLFGNNLDVIAPIEKVLLMFSTTPVDTGTVIMQAYGPGLLIDLTSSNERVVHYDINATWDWGKMGWGQQVKAQEDLLPLLIESGAKTFRRRSLVG